jgi:hypothetical protein
MVVEQGTAAAIHRAQRGEFRGVDAEFSAEAAPQRPWDDAKVVKQTPFMRRKPISASGEAPVGCRAAFSSRAAGLKVKKTASNLKGLNSPGSSRTPRDVVCQPCVAPFVGGGAHVTQQKKRTPIST